MLQLVIDSIKIKTVFLKHSTLHSQNIGESHKTMLQHEVISNTTTTVLIYYL